MNDGCACVENAAPDRFPMHLIGVGPDEEFVIAKQLTSGPVIWLGNVENLETFLGRPPFTSPYVVLLDGLLLSQLIAKIDQCANFIKENTIILQIAAPPVRLVVEVMRRGVRDVIQKPYTLARLRSALEELCGGHGRWPP